MIRTDELRGIIAKNGYSQAKVAEAIGISPKTFYEKMSRGVFGSDEIEMMIQLLHIDDPVAIFLPDGNFISYRFPPGVTNSVTHLERSITQ